jgi:hypothetical protein
MNRYLIVCLSLMMFTSCNSNPSSPSTKPEAENNRPTPTFTPTKPLEEESLESRSCSEPPCEEDKVLNSTTTTGVGVEPPYKDETMEPRAIRFPKEWDIGIPKEPWDDED